MRTHLYTVDCTIRIRGPGYPYFERRCQKLEFPGSSTVALPLSLRRQYEILKVEQVLDGTRTRLLHRTRSLSHRRQTRIQVSLRSMPVS
jgi:hypothetical protein